jgi:hypothetical protein
LAERVPARLSPAEGRKFGLTVGAAFAVLAGITWWRDHELLLRAFAGISGALILAGLVVPARLGPVFRAWMGLALLISRVTTPIFLAIVYFLVIAPVGLLMRLLGRNPLRHEPEGGSLWLSRPKERGTMSNQF